MAPARRWWPWTRWPRTAAWPTTSPTGPPAPSSWPAATRPARRTRRTRWPSASSGTRRCAVSCNAGRRRSLLELDQHHVGRGVADVLAHVSLGRHPDHFPGLEGALAGGAVGKGEAAAER